MKNVPKAAALVCTATLACAGAISSALAGATVPGWPSYIAMGAVGGPDADHPVSATSRGDNDDFGGRPVDVVFKYAGENGNGDPGVIDPPTNALRMTGDMITLSSVNRRPMRVAIVEYTAQMSGGFRRDDFTNDPEAHQHHPTGSYFMARHFISLGADAIAMNDEPVVYKGKNYFGTLILNPDLMGAIEQGGFIRQTNRVLPPGLVNTAVDQALCVLTTKHHYLNTYNPNGLSNPKYLNKTYTGTPVAILEQMLADGYPVWSIESQNDPYWNINIDNLMGGSTGKYSQIGHWFNNCIANPTFSSKIHRPNFPAGFEGWVQANNWLIRTFSKQGHVTFGWQDNMWAVNTSFWLHKDLTNVGISNAYSKPVSNWLAANAPSTITTGALGASYIPDYFVFDRYETDDSSSPGGATLYNARSWDNYLTAVGQVSANFDNIPVMMWQIPGSHIPYVGEKNPELLSDDTPGEHVFSTAPVYFFGDSNLTADLSNIIAGPASSTDANSAVGNFQLNCGATFYNCTPGSDYQQYLLAYRGKPDNFDWGKDNKKLAFAAQNNVFAILWGGGSTTSVIKNFMNHDDHGWLAAKIKAYYKSPTPVVNH